MGHCLGFHLKVQAIVHSMQFCGLTEGTGSCTFLLSSSQFMFCWELASVPSRHPGASLYCYVIPTRAPILVQPLTLLHGLIATTPISGFKVQIHWMILTGMPHYLCVFTAAATRPCFGFSTWKNERLYIQFFVDPTTIGHLPWLIGCQLLRSSGGVPRVTSFHPLA